MIKYSISNFRYSILSCFFAAIFFLATGLFFPCAARAATFYFDPPQETVGPNQTIEVKIKVGVGSDECINVAQVAVDFPQDILELKDFNSGDSFFSIWVQKPDKSSIEKSNEEGKLVFSGGIPGGYCGTILGDPGESNIIGSLIFSVKKPVSFHKANIYFNSNTQALLNDGEGTEAAINSQGAVFQIDEKITTTTNVWAEQLAEDNIPPEPFIIEINNNPRIASGKYFLVFSTVDKQTGVDYYEVLETKAKNLASKQENSFQKFSEKLFKVKNSTVASELWVKADSPYVFKDQSLNSVIKVKAVDKAGNERVVEYDNAALQSLKSQTKFNWRPLAFAATAIIILFVIIPIIIIQRKKARKR
jgi:hypothetical protein